VRNTGSWEPVVLRTGAFWCSRDNTAISLFYMG